MMMIKGKAGTKSFVRTEEIIDAKSEIIEEETNNSISDFFFIFFHKMILVLFSTTIVNKKLQYI